MNLAFQADPRGDQFYALTTFRRDGSAVSTPIWLAPAGGRWYGYTPARSGKVRRIARNENIEVASSDFHGEPRGDWRTGRARILPRSQLSTAKRALRGSTARSSGCSWSPPCSADPGSAAATQSVWRSRSPPARWMLPAPAPSDRNVGRRHAALRRAGRGSSRNRIGDRSRSA